MVQMTIFDFLSEERSLDNIPEAEMVQEISDATGIDFKYKDELWGYVAKKGKYHFNVRYSNYSMRDNKSRFISCGYGSNKEGAGSPCDTVKRAIEFFKAGLIRAEEMEGKQ